MDERRRPDRLLSLFRRRQFFCAQRGAAVGEKIVGPRIARGLNGFSRSQGVSGDSFTLCSSISDPSDEGNRADAEKQKQPKRD